MFETGIRQFRMALAMITGRRISPRLIERLVGDALATLHEFGSPGDDVRELLDGPFADPETREHFQTQGLRRTARRAASHSPYYREQFAATGLDPAELTLDRLSGIPLTAKADLVSRGPEFVCDDVTPYLSTRTTGTTGKPTEIWASVYEATLWPALAALSGLLRDEIRPEDCMQVSISSRATAAIQHNIEVCRMIGARTRILGQVPPGQCVDSLADREPTMLGIYPSYLGQIVTEARRRGMGPGDFNLRVVNVGGEVLSAALRAAARETFGADVNDTFAMTEILPVSGRFCASGHLHPDLNMGLVEVVALDGTGTAAPGELGRMVVTPYFPYRDCMPVLRYDTGDVVRVLPDEPPACEFQAIPAVSTIEGKAAQVARSRTGPVTTRDIVEVLEALPSQVWPARYRTAPKPDGGGLLLTVAPEVLDGLTTAEVRDRFADRGVECEVEAAAPGAFLRHVRADLTESTFTDVRTPAGV